MNFEGEWTKPLRWLLLTLLTATLLLALLWPAAAWGAATSASSEVSGATLFARTCAGCHSNGGNIIRRGKTLKRKALARNHIDGPIAIKAIASGGIGQMSGYEELLGEGGAQVVADWVWDQALAGWPQS